MSARNTAHLKLVQRGASSSVAADALAGAVTTEIRLLEDLIGVMRKQRSAVAADDLQGVDDSVFATHRILVTLGEARRQRQSLGRLIGGSDDVGLRSLDDVAGELLTEGLRVARDGLRAAALTLSREVEMNRQILRSALSNGGDLVRGLYGAPDAYGTYRPEARTHGEAEAAGGLLINRHA